MGLYLGISLFLFTAPSITFSQKQNSEKLTGIIRVKKEESYPYEINFKTDSLGKISGYSIFNPKKSTETKSLLQGRFLNGKLEFKEYKVIATKSVDPDSRMCYIHYKGEVKKVLSAQMVVGEFKGVFNNGKQCAEGTINFVAREKFFQKMDSQRTEVAKKKDSDTNSAYVAKFLKSVPIQKTDNATSTIYWNTDTLHFRVWDPDKVDNDRVTISVNGRVIEPNLKLSEREFIYKERITNNTTVVIRALNVGFLPPNTTKVIFLNGKQDHFYLNNLGENTSSTFNLIKK